MTAFFDWFDAVLAAIMPPIAIVLMLFFMGAINYIEQEMKRDS